MNNSDVDWLSMGDSRDCSGPVYDSVVLINLGLNSYSGDRALALVDRDDVDHDQLRGVYRGYVFRCRSVLVPDGFFYVGDAGASETGSVAGSTRPSSIPAEE